MPLIMNATSGEGLNDVVFYPLTDGIKSIVRAGASVFV
jgi:hypothetical protein